MRFFLTIATLLFSTLLSFAQTLPVPAGGRLTFSNLTSEPRADIVGATKLYYSLSSSIWVAELNSSLAVQNMQFTSSPTDTVGLTLDASLNPANFPPNTIFSAFTLLNGSALDLCLVPWSSSTAGASTPPGPAGTPAWVPYLGIPTNPVALTCFDSTATPVSLPANQGHFHGLVLSGAVQGSFDLKFGNAALGGGGARISIWNLENDAPLGSVVQDTTSNWTPQAGAWENLNAICTGCVGGQHNNITFVTGGGFVSADLNMGVYPNVGANIYVGIGYDLLPPTIGPWSKCGIGVGGPTSSSSIFHDAPSHCQGYFTPGLHILQAMEYGTAAYSPSPPCTANCSSGQLYSDQNGQTQMGALSASWRW
jgi:hypothetical protein